MESQRWGHKDKVAEVKSRKKNDFSKRKSRSRRVAASPSSSITVVLNSAGWIGGRSRVAEVLSQRWGFRSGVAEVGSHRLVADVGSQT